MNEEQKATITLSAIISVIGGTLDSVSKVRAIERIVESDKRKEFF